MPGRVRRVRHKGTCTSRTGSPAAATRRRPVPHRMRCRARRQTLPIGLASSGRRQHRPGLTVRGSAGIRPAAAQPLDRLEPVDRPIERRPPDRPGRGEEVRRPSKHRAIALNAEDNPITRLQAERVAHRFRNRHLPLRRDDGFVGVPASPLPYAARTLTLCGAARRRQPR